MTREEMRDTIVRIYGLEHPVTIQFFEMDERLEENPWNDTCLEVLVLAHMENPMIDENF